MPRKPFGTYARSTPDWYAAQSAWGSAQAASQPGVGCSCSLYNDANDGSVLWVYGLRCDVSPSLQLFCLSVRGVVGSLWLPGFPLVAGNATPYGSTYAGATPGFADLITVPLTWEQTNGESAPFFPGQPFAALPPGFSLCVYTAAVQAALLANFWWTVIPSQT